MMMAQKTLYILRHAKAAGGAEDHVRPLAERGIHEAEAMGKFLTAEKFHPMQVYCSTSVRTRETWQHVRKHYKENPPIEYTDKLYLSSSAQMLKFIAAVPKELSSILLIGHNPGLHELSAQLVKSGDDHMLRELSAAFPPCSFVAIRFTDMTWQNIELGGTLTTFKMMEVA